MSNLSFFKKTKSPQLETDIERNNIKVNESKEEANGFLSKIKSFVAKSEPVNVQPEKKSLLEKSKDYVKEHLEIEKSYKAFFITLLIGLGVIFLSFLFIPVIILFPQKFVSLFSLGSFIVLVSFIFIHGTFAYLEMLFNKKRILFTFLYLVSLVSGIVLAVKGIYVFSLVCAGFQLFAVIVFGLSFIPGGSFGINLLFRMVSSPIKKMTSNLVN